MSPMNLPPPLPSRPEDEDALEASVQALAAGELDAAAAERLEARIAAEPALERLVAEARRVEERLREEPLLPLPLHLVGRILAATTPRRVRPAVFFARAAACVLVFFASWIAYAGEVPEMADVAAHPRLVASIEQTSFPAAPDVQGLLARTAGTPVAASDSAAFASLGLGLLLLVVGIWFALATHRASRVRAGAAPVDVSNGGDA